MPILGIIASAYRSAPAVTTTYEAIATVTVTNATAASIDFTSIPGTYTDLSLFISARTNRNADSDFVEVTANANAGTYTTRYIRSDGSAVASETVSAAYWEVHRTDAATATASTFGNINLYIPNYAGSNNKSASYDGVNENNATSAYTYLGAVLWSNTSAITSLELKPGVGSSFVQYSSATLYGIKNS